MRNIASVATASEQHEGEQDQRADDEEQNHEIPGQQDWSQENCQPWRRHVTHELLEALARQKDTAGHSSC